MVLPEACRDCGLITVGGIQVPLPPELEESARSMAEASEHTGKEVAAELMEADPATVRVEKYFSRVYESAYLDGFVRALAFFQHEAKEGRLFRLRELWKNGFTVEYEKNVGHPEVLLVADKASYTEFSKLLQSGERHGTSSENQHPTRQESSTHVP